MRRGRRCQFCADAISAERRIDAKYCRDSCKTLAYQKRKGTRRGASTEPPPPSSALSELVTRLQSQEEAARSELAAVRGELSALRQRTAELEAALQRLAQTPRDCQPPPAPPGPGSLTQAASPLAPRPVPDWTQVPEQDDPSITRIVDWVLDEHLPAHLAETRPELARRLAQLSSQWRAILQVIGQTLAHVMGCQRVYDKDASGATLTQVAINSLPQLKAGLQEKAPTYATELERWFAEHSQLLAVLAEQLAWALSRRWAAAPPG